MTYSEFCKRARAYQNKTGMWRVEIDTSVPNRMVTTSTDYPCEKAQDSLLCIVTGKQIGRAHV